MLHDKLYAIYVALSVSLGYDSTRKFLSVCAVLVLQERIRGVRTLFRDASQTEFIIATIPTQLGIAESRRLLAALQEETIPCKRIIVNQVRCQKLISSIIIWSQCVASMIGTVPFSTLMKSHQGPVCCYFVVYASQIVVYGTQNCLWVLVCVAATRPV